jgi:hypothetical protein
MDLTQITFHLAGPTRDNWLRILNEVDKSKLSEEDIVILNEFLINLVNVHD